MKQNCLLVTIDAPALPFVMHAQEVGANKPYIDKGLFNHALSGFDFSALVESLDGTPAYIAIPGYVLDALNTTQRGQLKLLSEKQVRFVNVPYFNSTPAALPREELDAQLEKNALTLNAVLGVKPVTSLFSSDTSIAGIIHEQGNGVFMLSKDDQTYHTTMESSAFSSAQSAKLVVLPHTAFSDATQLVHFSELQESFGWLEEIETYEEPYLCASDELDEHVYEEFKGLYPYILKTQDEDLLEDWRLLTQRKMQGDMYEHYASTMNVLNDIAHKLRNVALSKQGKFEPEPTLVDTPTAHVEMVFK